MKLKNGDSSKLDSEAIFKSHWRNIVDEDKVYGDLKRD